MGQPSNRSDVQASTRPRSFSGLLTLLAWVIFIIALPGAVYGWYVFGQLDAIQQRGQ